MFEHRICLMNDSFPPLIDGVANTVLNYANVLHGAGAKPVVVTPDYPGWTGDDYPFPVLRYPSLDVRRWASGYVAGIPFSPQMAGRLCQEQVELIHVHCPIVSAFLARELRQQMHVPLILTYHTKFDIDIANVIHSRALQEGSIRALAANISAFDEVWVVSRGAGENLRSLGYEGEYLVMPNGVDLPRGRSSPQAVAQATAAYDLPEGVPVYLFVGRIMWYKGLKLILDALAALRQRGTAFRMVLIGAGADAPAVRDYAETLGLGDWVFFTGALTDREELRAWYTRSSLFLFPSTFDTNGLVVREAAACGLASVLIQGSCAAEGVTEGRNALLIEETPEALAQILQTVCDPQQLRSLGQHAADELYLSWQDAILAACDRYEVVLDRYRRGEYEEHHRMADAFLASQGDLMEALAELERSRTHLEAQARERWIVRREQVREFREELEDHRQSRRENAQQHRERMRERREEFWNKLDRYL